VEDREAILENLVYAGFVCGNLPGRAGFRVLKKPVGDRRLDINDD